MMHKRSRTVAKVSLRDIKKISLFQEFRKLKKFKGKRERVTSIQHQKEPSVEDKIIEFATSMPSGHTLPHDFRPFGTAQKPSAQDKLYVLNKFLLKNSNKNVKKLVRIFQKFQQEKQNKNIAEFVPNSLRMFNQSKNPAFELRKTPFINRIKVPKVQPLHDGALTRNNTKLNLRVKNKSNQKMRLNLSPIKNHYNSFRSSRRGSNQGSNFGNSHRSMNFKKSLYNAGSSMSLKHRILNANSKQEFMKLSKYFRKNSFMSPDEPSDYPSYREMPQL
ncbi:unnamed protein product [Moneuplotes crassus]|uniref:Uncharacterized protein n=1 Tax=Euplotes crassus TaxID=5936 RepID=A0AAD1XPY2_EUPCR|nr:unnamed protein product [Moneuplotes crassus]